MLAERRPHIRNAAPGRRRSRASACGLARSRRHMRFRSDIRLASLSDNRNSLDEELRASISIPVSSLSSAHSGPARLHGRFRRRGARRGRRKGRRIVSLTRASDPVNHLAGAGVGLGWADGATTLAELPPEEFIIEPEKVRYLSQHFVERLCSAAGLATELRQAMERVVFESTDRLSRLEADTFDDLAERSAAAGPHAVCRTSGTDRQHRRRDRPGRHSDR